MSELARIMQYGHCHEDVTRKGMSVPCDKTAVAVRVDEEDGGPYPVCAYHARGEMVSLPDLLAAVWMPNGLSNGGT
jgi:hypothetical protein